MLRHVIAAVWRWHRRRCRESFPRRPGRRRRPTASPEQKMQRRHPQPVKVGDLIGLPVLDFDDRTLRLRQERGADSGRQDQADRALWRLPRLGATPGSGADRGRRHRGPPDCRARHDAGGIRCRAGVGGPAEPRPAGERDHPHRPLPALSGTRGEAHDRHHRHHSRHPASRTGCTRSRSASCIGSTPSPCCS